MIICEVNKNHLNVRTRELLTAGSQNVNTVEFRFNAAWDGLAKTATFKTSKKTISVLLNTNTTAIPWETLADAGEILAVGVFGVSGETLVLPTVWGILGKVMDAAHLGDEEKEPTPDVYQKILDELNALERPTWDSVQNKPFSTLGSGLSVDENGVLSAQGGGGSANAVQYVAQTLTDEQKAQARENIGAGTSSFSGSYNDLMNKPTIPTQVTIDSTLMQSGQAADAKAVGDALQDYVTSDEWYEVTAGIEQAFGTITQALDTKLDKNQGAANAGKILGIGEDGIVVPQDKPTYTLPQATADALGGIKADAATAEDTQVVRIGTDGKLRTKPTGGSSITVDSELSSTSTNPVQNKVVTSALAEKITAPTTAAVGQIIKVKTVDDAGKPAEWEAADLPSGGEKKQFAVIFEQLLDNSTVVSVDDDGTYNEVIIELLCPPGLAAAFSKFTIILGVGNTVNGVSIANASGNNKGFWLHVTRCIDTDGAKCIQGAYMSTNMANAAPITARSGFNMHTAKVIISPIKTDLMTAGILFRSGIAIPAGSMLRISAK